MAKIYRVIQKIKSVSLRNYQQSVFKRYYSDKHFSELLPTRWRQKSTGIDMEQNYVTVTLCIWQSIATATRYDMIVDLLALKS